MKKHFLTFILPCYNYAEIIEQSLNSIYQQTNLQCEFEVICTDDGSTDPRTPSILTKWAQTHDNFHAYFHSENKGEGGALNTCIEHSKGDLFFCLDTDNELVPNSVQGLINLLDTVNVGSACFNQLKYFNDVNRVHEQMNEWTYVTKDNIVDIQHQCSTGMTPASSGNYLFTKESYERAGRYPENNCMGSWCFGFKQLATGGKIVVLPNTFYWHRYSSGGMYLTNLKTGQIHRDVWDVVKEFFDIFTDETKALLEIEGNNLKFVPLTNSKQIKIRSDYLKRLHNV